MEKKKREERKKRERNGKDTSKRKIELKKNIMFEQR